MLLLITNATGAVSLNLQTACHHIIIMEIPISYYILVQILGRINRIGQSFEQFIYLLFCYDTFDQYSVNRMFRKMIPILAGEGNTFTDEDPTVDAENKLMVALGVKYSFLNDRWATPPWSNRESYTDEVDKQRESSNRWLMNSSASIAATPVKPRAEVPALPKRTPSKPQKSHIQNILNGKF
jgi:hypothetical protein